MQSSILLVALVGLTQIGSAAAQQPSHQSAVPIVQVPKVSCPSPRPFTDMRVTACAHIEASAPLRLPGRRSSMESSTRALRGAGRGALIGLGLGLGIGGIAALLFGGECEEGHAGCTAGLIVGGAALGAGVGAIVGAVMD